MQTYYELEDYHWHEINRRDFIKGRKVWFADINAYDDMVGEGVIVGHGIHIEGDVELILEVTKEYDDSIPDDVWINDGTERKKVSSYEYTTTVFMDHCFDTKKEAISCAKELIKHKIRRYEELVKYEEIKLQELENM